MRPYGCENIQSPKHVKRGGAPDGWYINWNSYCRCCDAMEKNHKVLKKRARREGKKRIQKEIKK